MMHQRRHFGLIKCIWKGNYDSININFQSCGEIDNNRRFEVVGLMNISIELLMTEQSMWRKNE